MALDLVLCTGNDEAELVVGPFHSVMVHPDRIAASSAPGEGGQLVAVRHDAGGWRYMRAADNFESQAFGIAIVRESNEAEWAARVPGSHIPPS